MVKRSLLVVLVSALAAAPPAHAQSACTATTLDAYVALGSTGCTVGNVVFKNFVFQAQGDAGVVFSPATAAGITVTPTLVTESPTSTRAGFAYTGNFGVTLPANTNASLLIFFEYLSLDSHWVVQQFIGSRGAWTQTGGTATQFLFEWGPDLAHLDVAHSLMVSSIFANVNGPGAGGVGLGRILGTALPNAGSVTSTELDAQVRITQTVTATPEPATLALTATGLIGLVGVVRRKR